MNRLQLISKLDTRSGFNEVVEQHMSSTPTQRQAYEAAEAQRMLLIGKRRYSDWDSFRVQRSKYMKKRR